MDDPSPEDIPGTENHPVKFETLDLFFDCVTLKAGVGRTVITTPKVDTPKLLHLNYRRVRVRQDQVTFEYAPPEYTVLRYKRHIHQVVLKSDLTSTGFIDSSGLGFFEVCAR